MEITSPHSVCIWGGWRCFQSTLCPQHWSLGTKKETLKALRSWWGYGDLKGNGPPSYFPSEQSLVAWSILVSQIEQEPKNSLQFQPPPQPPAPSRAPRPPAPSQSRLSVQSAQATGHLLRVLALGTLSQHFSLRPAEVCLLFCPPKQTEPTGSWACR